jgi:hypothetical protein
VPQVHSFLGVSYEKGLCHKCCRTIEDLRFDQSVEWSLAGVLFVRPWLMVVRICIVDFLGIFIVNLKLYEVDALLKQVDVTEVLKVKDKFSTRPVSHLN